MLLIRAVTSNRLVASGVLNSRSSSTSFSDVIRPCWMIGNKLSAAFFCDGLLVLFACREDYECTQRSCELCTEVVTLTP